MDRPQARELADDLYAQGWTSAHVVETGRDDCSVKVIIPAYDRYDERVILVDAYQAFGGVKQGWDATAFDGDAIEPTETLVTYDERGIVDMLAALRARQLDRSRSVVTGQECERCGSDYRTSTAFGRTLCRHCDDTLFFVSIDFAGETPSFVVDGCDHPEGADGNGRCPICGVGFAPWWRVDEDEQ